MLYRLVLLWNEAAVVVIESLSLCIFDFCCSVHMVDIFLSVFVRKVDQFFLWCAVCFILGFGIAYTTQRHGGHFATRPSHFRYIYELEAAVSG